MPDNHPLPECLLRFDALSKQLEHAIELLEGNGKPGIRIELDRLTQAEKRRNVYSVAAITALIGLVAERAYSLLGGKQ